MKKIGVMFALFALCSCASAPVVQLTETFDEAEAGKLMKDGKNTILGSAVWREKNGHIQKCSGYQVTLYPATKYAEERMVALYGSAERGSREIGKDKVVFAPDELNFYQLSKKSVCDVDGKFEFEDIADGDYIVETKIVWGNPEEPDMQTEGGKLIQKVSVKGGKKVKIVLSPYL